MVVSDARRQRRVDGGPSGSPDDPRVSPGGTPSTVLTSATRNRKHPPTVSHVNACSECLAWVMDYMFNVAKSMERKFR